MKSFGGVKLMIPRVIVQTMIHVICMILVIDHDCLNYDLRDLCD